MTSSDNDDDGESAAGGRLAHLLQILELESKPNKHEYHRQKATCLIHLLYRCPGDCQPLGE
jgi:hypothetical protein